MSLEGKSEQEVAALAMLANGLMNNKATRGKFQRLLKEANPNLTLPEVEIEDRIEAAVKPVQEELNKTREELRTKEQTQYNERLFNGLRDAGHVSTEADFEALVKYAVDNGFQATAAGLRLAAQHRDAEKQSAEPTTPQTFQQILPKDNADLMKNPRGWANQAAHNALNDLRKGMGKVAAR